MSITLRVKYNGEEREIHVDEYDAISDVQGVISTTFNINGNFELFDENGSNLNPDFSVSDFNFEDGSVIIARSEGKRTVKVQFNGKTYEFPFTESSTVDSISNLLAGEANVPKEDIKLMAGNTPLPPDNYISSIEGTLRAEIKPMPVNPFNGDPKPQPRPDNPKPQPRPDNPKPQPRPDNPIGEIPKPQHRQGNPFVDNADTSSQQIGNNSSKDIDKTKRDSEIIFKPKPKPKIDIGLKVPKPPIQQPEIDVSFQGTGVRTTLQFSRSEPVKEIISRIESFIPRGNGTPKLIINGKTFRIEDLRRKSESIENFMKTNGIIDTSLVISISRDYVEGKRN